MTSTANPPVEGGNASLRTVGIWLLACCVTLAALVVVGGLTRLTHSGLSIAEWKPVTGTLPPIGEAAWNETFARYRETPEYRQVNRGMSLDEFRTIYWWEYVHRLLARLLGALFLVPLIVFVARRRVGGALAWKLSGIFLLGAAQGALGWYMVASGLVDVPRVSHLRLAAHLGLAFALFAAMLWLALDLLRPRIGPAGPGAGRSPASWLASGIVLLTGLQALSGALVAGTHAGLAFNNFPLMAGKVVPPGIWSLTPAARNLVDNLITVQFVHRTLAWALLVAVPICWWRVRRAHAAALPRRAVDLQLAVVLCQFALGVTTLVLAVPVGFAAAHQAGALALLAASTLTAHVLRHPGREPGAARAANSLPPR